jgi:hypothetical protein
MLSRLGECNIQFQDITLQIIQIEVVNIGTP